MQRWFRGHLTCSKEEIGWNRFTKVARYHYGLFEKYTAIMPRGGNIHKIWGFIHLSVSIIRGRGKIGELYSRIRS